MSGTGRFGYKLPLAYFLTGLVVYIYSFVATLRKQVKKFESYLEVFLISLLIFLEWLKIQECPNYHPKMMNVFSHGKCSLDGIL